MRALDIVGKRFGRLVAIEIAVEEGRYGATFWRCRCDCGVEKAIARGSLVSGLTTSCGCYNRQQLLMANTTHGKSNAKVYRVWCGMRERCNNPKSMSYHNYGGRGIRVCDRWLKFENFLSDMGEPPTPKHEIDRLDTNGNYEPSNCRWVTHARNAYSRRNVKLTAADAVLIRQLFATGVPRREIHTMFNADKSVINRLIAGRIWKEAEAELDETSQEKEIATRSG